MSLKFVWSLFAGLGGLFVAIALVLVAVDVSFFADARRTDGEVIDLRWDRDGLGAPDVAYRDDLGQRRVYHSNHYLRPAYEIGDHVTIAHDRREPDRAAIDSWTQRWLLPAIFGGIGGVQLLVGLLGLTRRARRKREIARLLREGQRVEARVVAVTQDTSLRVNRRSPWVIHCEARLPGEAGPRTFVSRRFWVEPDLGRSTLPVCYDPRDPARHVVDTGDLDPRRSPGPRQT